MKDAILVIGGGIAGINCARNIAAWGTKVYLVDDTPSIGGMMARLDKTFPTNDCSICIEAPQMFDVDNHPQIEILTNTAVKKVKPVAGGFKVRLVKKAKFVDEAKCTGCGACVEACPVSLPDELDGKIGGTRKLISMAFPQAVPNTVSLDPRCRYGEMQRSGACIGGCDVDCIQCRECPIAFCVKACEKEGKKAVELWQSNKNIKIDVGAIVVATGIAAAPPAGDLIDYSVHRNVITGLEFERMMNAGGPTAGHIIRPSDGAPARHIAWIQCAGRGLAAGRGLPYCSKICCMISAKQCIIAKEHDADVGATVFYNDLKAYGKGFWEFYRKARSHGVRYVRARPYAVAEKGGNEHLLLTYEDLDTGQAVQEIFDLVVLATGILPCDRNRKLAGVLGIELDHLGFFKEIDPLLDPLASTRPGIYLCGGATGPIDIAESVVQACAAAMKAVTAVGSRSEVGGQKSEIGSRIEERGP